MLRLQLQNFLAVLPFFALAQAVLPPTGTYRIFNTNSTGGHNVFGVADADRFTAAPNTPILAQSNNTDPANSWSQRWIASQAFLRGVNFYSFTLERFDLIGYIWFAVPHPGTGSGATIDYSPMSFTLNETSPGVYTIVVAKTNLALTATDAPGKQIVVQRLNATNPLQYWQFAEDEDVQVPSV